MESNVENFGSWQSNTCSGAAVLRVPAATAPFAATGLAFAGAVATDVVATDASYRGLGQPKAMTTPRTHKSITRPGSPPRGRTR